MAAPTSWAGCTLWASASRCSHFRKPTGDHYFGRLRGLTADNCSQDRSSHGSRPDAAWRLRIALYLPLDTDAEDHIADETRYACLARVVPSTFPKPETADDRWRKNRPKVSLPPDWKVL